MNCSDGTPQRSTQEVRKVLQESYDEAKRLLTEHRRGTGSDRRVPDRERKPFPVRNLWRSFIRWRKRIEPESASEAAEVKETETYGTAKAETSGSSEDCELPGRS